MGLLVKYLINLVNPVRFSHCQRNTGSRNIIRLSLALHMVSPAPSTWSVHLPSMMTQVLLQSDSITGNVPSSTSVTLEFRLKIQVLNNSPQNPYQNISVSELIAFQKKFNGRKLL